MLVFGYCVAKWISCKYDIYLLFFGFPSHWGHRGAVSRAACAIEYVLTVCALSLSRVRLSCERVDRSPLCSSVHARIFLGKNTGVGCHFLLWRSSRPRDQTCTSCISYIDRWIVRCWATSVTCFIHSINGVHMSIPVPPLIPHPPFLPWCPYISFVLYSCVSDGLYQFVQIPHTCVSMWYLFFWLHSVWQSLGPSTSLHMTQFCSSLRLSSIPLYLPMCVCVYTYTYTYIDIYAYIHHTFFTDSSFDGHLGCSHVLAIVNSATVKIGVHVSLWQMCHVCYGQIMIIQARKCKFAVQTEKYCGENWWMKKCWHGVIGHFWRTDSWAESWRKLGNKTHR